MTENERRIIRSCISNGFEFISRSFDSGNITIKIGDELFDFDRLRELAVEVEEALDKQTPEKPKIKKYEHKRDSGYYCPKCGDWIGTVGIPFDFEAEAFCETCGQKIDWTWADDE